MPELVIEPTDKLKIGIKQTTKTLLKNKARRVYVAEDAEQHVTRQIIELCEKKDVELIRVPSMALLGEACHIDVGAATAVLEK